MAALETAGQPSPRGVRVVVDARPVQEPERSPLTAWYLDQLLRAFAAQPLEGESFVIVSRALRDDPAPDLEDAGLAVAASRRIPPTTRALRSAGLTLDSFLLRGAALGAAPEEGAVFHTAGGAVPLASSLPVVATLLDLAAWELPDRYAASPAARFGHRLRARVLRDAERVIVCARGVAESARRRLHLPADRLAVVPLAVDAEFRAAASDAEAIAKAQAELELPRRYLAFSGRYDARKDLATLYRSLAVLRDRTPLPTGGRRVSPPMLVIGLPPDAVQEQWLIERSAAVHGLSELVRTVTTATPAQRAALLAGAQAVVYPVLSDATAQPVLEALAAGVPVVGSRVGAVPETIGSAGIVVEPRDVSRMAAALEAVWATGALSQQLRRQARRRAEADRRTWADVALETRRVYAAAAR